MGGSQRVDDVQLDIGTQPLEHLLGVLAAQGADLDDAPRSGRLDHGGNDIVPELVHGAQRWRGSARRWHSPSSPAATGLAHSRHPTSAGEAERPAAGRVAAGVR
jgi:hypothetical protein